MFSWPRCWWTTSRRTPVGCMWDCTARITEDLLAKDLAEFLREHGGEWKDEPNVLHDELDEPRKRSRAGKAGRVEQDGVRDIEAGHMAEGRAGLEEE